MAVKRLVVVAGPNGAGKSTFAVQFAQEAAIDYLGADDIALSISGRPDTNPAIAAGRGFFGRLDSALSAQHSLVIESTLSGMGLLRHVSAFRQAGYAVTIVFVYMADVQECLARIAARVAKGGHDVPERDVRRRFVRSVRNFWHHYRKAVDRWQLLHNGGERPIEVAWHDSGELVVVDEGYFAEFRELAGRL